MADGTVIIETKLNSSEAKSGLSRIKSAFQELGNDPQAFVEFCSDEANLDEMRKLGLAIPAKVEDSGAGVVKKEECQTSMRPNLPLPLLADLM